MGVDTGPEIYRKHGTLPSPAASAAPCQRVSRRRAATGRFRPTSNEAAQASPRPSDERHPGRQRAPAKPATGMQPHNQASRAS